MATTPAIPQSIVDKIRALAIAIHHNPASVHEPVPAAVAAYEDLASAIAEALESGSDERDKLRAVLQDISTRPGIGIMAQRVAREGLASIQGARA